MNPTIPILLLATLTLTVWVLRDSAVKLWLKLVAIAALTLFSTVFWSASHTMFGWAAEKGMPERLAISAVVVREPIGDLAGGIYLVVDHSVSRYDSMLLATFGYKPEHIEPRLFRLPYLRRLHEQLESEVIPRLRQGQTVYGRFQKRGDGGGKNGKKGGGKHGDPPGRGEGRDGKKGKTGDPSGIGEGSESPEGGLEFHELPPTYIQPKTPEDEKKPVPQPPKKRKFMVMI